MRHFFLSYSPGDDDLYVHRFYHHLSDAVRGLLGKDPDAEVGFLDRGSTGNRWPAELRHELATCQTLIVLCAPKLFLNNRCGQAWSVFSDRLRIYRGAEGPRTQALIAVPWRDAPLSILEEASDDLHVMLGPAAAPDLQTLIRLFSLQREYQDFVTRLARHVVETSGRHRIPEAPRTWDFHTAPSAFEPWRERLVPQRVHFFVAAGTREQMRSVRHDLNFYGRREEDWTPYRPASAQSLAERASEVAKDQVLNSEVVAIGKLGERLASVRGRNEIIVVLLDSWSTKLDHMRMALTTVDRSPESIVAILVPASKSDGETRDHRVELRTRVQKLFPNYARRRDTLLRTEIETPTHFDEDLTTALTEAQNRILFAKGPVVPPPRSGPGATKPRLEGPQS